MSNYRTRFARIIAAMLLAGLGVFAAAAPADAANVIRHHIAPTANGI